MRQSVVSKRVRHLEDEFGASFLERHREGVRLTHTGTTLREALEPLLHQLDGALHGARVGATRERAAFPSALRRGAVELPDLGPSGGFFRDGKPVSW